MIIKAIEFKNPVKYKIKISIIIIKIAIEANFSASLEYPAKWISVLFQGVIIEVAVLKNKKVRNKQPAEIKRLTLK